MWAASSRSCGCRPPVRRAKLPDFTQQEGTTTVPLNLDSYESVFVVFAEPVKAGKSPKVGSVTNYPSPALLTEISGPWNVSFDQKMRGPVNPVVMPRLQPWNEMPNDSVKYYSGTAVYTTGFDLVKLPANERILLDLGKLSAMGKVYVNGNMPEAYGRPRTSSILRSG